MDATAALGMRPKLARDSPASERPLEGWRLVRTNRVREGDGFGRRFHIQIGTQPTGELVEHLDRAGAIAQSVEQAHGAPEYPLVRPCMANGAPSHRTGLRQLL